MSERPCSLLAWDSEFFGLRIARLEAEHLTAELAPAILAWCKAESIDCLYFLAGASDSGSVRLAERLGFALVDIRVTLESLARTAEADPRVRSARPDDLPRLQAIARVSHRDSRFYHDPMFDRTRCDALYDTWIQRSCAGWADVVLVAEDSGKPAGYVSCHLDSGEGRIGLVAVTVEFQGKGLGRALVHAALDWFARHNARHVTVVTQGRNIPATRLYESCGFRALSTQLWFHRWFIGVDSP